MGDLVFAEGTKDNTVEDVHVISRGWLEDPQVMMVSREEAEQVVVEQSSALFIAGNLVLALIDPPWETIGSLQGHLAILKEKIHIIIYSTSPLPTPLPFKARTVAMEQEKKKRLQDRVLRFLKNHGKVMTDKAYAIFSEWVRDESFLDQELLKLVNLSGDRRKIDSRDVQAIVTNTHEDSLITLSEAFSRSDIPKMLAVLDNLLANGLPLAAVQGFLVRQVRLLLHAKDLEKALGDRSDYQSVQKSISRWKSGLDPKPLEKRQFLPYQKPYYAFQLLKTSRDISASDLAALFSALYTYDRDTKKGAGHDRIRLEALLADK